MSDAARENYAQLYGSVWQEWQANVKRARPQANIARVTGDIPAWLASSHGDLARAALAAGLVDKIGTRVAWGERVAEVVGDDDWDETPGAFASTKLDAWLEDTKPKEPGDKIGVITIAGEISDGEAGPGEAGAERIVKLLDDALDDDLKALVVRVDSPGGTVTGSEAIRRAILRHKASKIPIVVSMGNVAASGGYWVSTPADHIFAEPETITGSIGIFGVVPTFEDALGQWGVTTDGVRTTPLSGQPDLFAGFTPETEALLQASVEAGYERFLALVGQSRRMTRDRVDELGQGRVWDGGSARQLGLVDQFGDLDAAIAYAADKAGLHDGDWHAEYLGADEDRYAPLFRRIWPEDDDSKAVAGDMFGLFARRQQDMTARVMADLNGLLEARGIQARCLECPAPVPPAAVAEPSGRTAQLLRWLLER